MSLQMSIDPVTELNLCGEVAIRKSYFRQGDFANTYEDSLGNKVRNPVSTSVAVACWTGQERE